MAKKTRVQKKLQQIRSEYRKRHNCKYPKFLETDGGVNSFERQKFNPKGKTIIPMKPRKQMEIPFADNLNK